MAFLVFQLCGPMAAWGEPATGVHRPTAEHPGWSAIVGLLGAALGLARDDEAAHAAMRDGFGHAVAVLDAGHLLRDYHTVQVPPRSALKGRPHASRRDELAIPSSQLSTIVSTRDHRIGGAWLVALSARAADTPPYTFAALADALRRPRYALFLGRRACPPAEPLWPQVDDDAGDAWDAFARYLERRTARWSDLDAVRVAQRQAPRPQGHTGTSRGRRPPWPVVPLAQHGRRIEGVRRVAFDDGIAAGADAAMTMVRHDLPLHRGRRQFGDRNEHLRVLIGVDFAQDPPTHTAPDEPRVPAKPSS